MHVTSFSEDVVLFSKALSLIRVFVYERFKNTVSSGLSQTVCPCKMEKLYIWRGMTSHKPTMQFTKEQQSFWANSTDTYLNPLLVNQNIRNWCSSSAVYWENIIHSPNKSGSSQPLCLQNHWSNYKETYSSHLENSFLKLKTYLCLFQVIDWTKFPFFLAGKFCRYKQQSVFQSI